jgi:signal peptidase I
LAWTAHQLKKLQRTLKYLIMFDFQKKNQFEYGNISIHDDRDIEVYRVGKISGQNLWSEGIRLVRDIVLIIAVFVLLGVFVAQPVVVEGTSMLPQLHDGERLLVNKLVYYKWQSVSWGHLERGDVVVFWFPNEPEKSYVKRVIGLPDETVEIKSGVVYINGTRLDEPYLEVEHNKSLPTFTPVKVNKHYYYLMGDNRDNSSDSRYWGLVPEKYIYGKAFFRYWQPTQIGFIEHGKYNIEEPNSNSNIDLQTEE